MPTYFEFFCGGGMVRAALGDYWNCLFANDFDHKKGASYRENWGADALVVDDINNVSVNNLASRSDGPVDLAWASFPCQDLSLAGGGAGLRGERSGTFWPFWERMKGLDKKGLGPKVIALENVCGTLTSHEGKDFVAIFRALTKLGYKVGALVIDAHAFLPQSRPRLFIICIKNTYKIPDKIIGVGPSKFWHTNALLKAYEKLPHKEKSEWVWWNLPRPSSRRKSLKEIVDLHATDIDWHTQRESRNILSMMSDVNKRKLYDAKKKDQLVVGTMYRRTRYENGLGKVQRIEARFDGIAGCLRTPAGGSSRQMIIVVDGQKVRTRLMSARETARLMGLRESYTLPPNFNEALHLTGDGVAVPAVRHLKKYLFELFLDANNHEVELAA